MSVNPRHCFEEPVGRRVAYLLPRQAPEVRRAATRHIKEMIDVVARQLPDWGQPAAHEHALVTVAASVGALLLARAVDDPKLSDALLEATLKHLAPTDT